MLEKQEQQILDLQKIDPAVLARAKDIAGKISLENSQEVIQYGVSAQTNISRFADTILAEIRNKDTGYVGEVLGDLVVKVRSLKVGELKSGGYLESLPIIGSLVSSVKRFITQYEKMSVQIERIVSELETAKMTLLKDIQMLDTLFQKNVEYMKDLDAFIAAGQIKIVELREKDLVALQVKAQDSGDPADAQRLQDFNQTLVRFEKKLHDLALSRMVSIQTSPQIRLIQGNNQTLVEKIQSSILTTIPLWKNQIVIAISIFRQKKALELQREVTDTTNDLLSKNSEMLKQGSIEVSKESERGIVDIETLKKVNADLITTIEETLKIQAEGKAKRSEAEKELVKMEDELKARLTSVQ